MIFWGLLLVVVLVLLFVRQRLRASSTFPPFLTLAESRARPDQASPLPQSALRPKPCYAVTGGTGLIGKKFVRKLLDMWAGRLDSDFVPNSVKQELAEGTLRLLMRPSTENQLLFKALKKDYPTADIQPVWGVGQAQAAIEVLLDGPVDYIFHIAAQGGDWGPIQTFYEANEVATRHLLLRALQINSVHPKFRISRFLHLSSVDIYTKDIPPSGCLGSPLTPLDLDSIFGYTVTKARADLLVQEAHDDFGLHTTILRPSAVYGTASYSFGRTEALEIHAGRMVAVDGGKAISGIVHVDDVVRSMMMAAVTSNTDGKVYNISDPSTGPWSRFYEFIAKSLNKERVFYSVSYGMAWVISIVCELTFRIMGWQDSRPLCTRFVLALVGRDQYWPIESCWEDFAWKPKANFEENMKEMCDYLIEHGLHVR